MDRAPSEKSPAPMEEGSTHALPATDKARPQDATLVQAHEQGEDENQETDVWWGAYDVRTMWPSFLVCLLLTAAIAWAAWHFWQVYRTDPRLVRYGTYTVGGLVWLIQLLRVLYRTVSINFRLTTHRLFQDRGFRNPAAGWVDLSRVVQVELHRNPVERAAGVGRVRVLSEDNAPEPFILHGVYHCQAVAAMIMSCAQRARAREAAMQRYTSPSRPGNTEQAPVRKET